jgi:hypothetical protein
LGLVRFNISFSLDSQASKGLPAMRAVFGGNDVRIGGFLKGVFKTFRPQSVVFRAGRPANALESEPSMQ